MRYVDGETVRIIKTKLRGLGVSKRSASWATNFLERDSVREYTLPNGQFLQFAVDQFCNIHFRKG